MSVAIVITTHNHYDATRDCIRSIYDTLRQVPHIIIVDDESTDNTLEKLKEEYPDFTYIPASVFSLGQSWNLGVKAAKAQGMEYVVILNNDIYFKQPNWLDILFKTFDYYPNTGIVGSKGLTPEGELEKPGMPRWGWGYRVAVTDHKAHYTRPASFFPFSQWISDGWYIAARILPSGQTPVSDTWGGCFLMPIRAIEDVGYFVDDYCFAYEEYQFSWKCWEKDYTVVWNTDAETFHLGGLARKGQYPKIVENKSRKFNTGVIHPSRLFRKRFPVDKRNQLWQEKIVPLLKAQGILVTPDGKILDDIS